MLQKPSSCPLIRRKSQSSKQMIALTPKVEDFKYLGAWMHSSDKDIKTRKAAEWRACGRLSQIWT
jgi:hypothetical protein